jgi:hypothetical protein
VPRRFASARAAFVRWEIISRSLLGHGGQNVNGEAGGLRHVAGDEIRAVLHQSGDERDIAGEPVEAGNQEHGAAFAAFGQGSEELGTVDVPAIVILSGIWD